MALFRLATEATRAMLLVYIQSKLDLSMSGRLFTHMLRLPLAFFVKRDDGDLVSRFHSLEPIRQLLAEGLLLALIDGVLTLGTLALMIVISPLLALRPGTRLPASQHRPCTDRRPHRPVRCQFPLRRQ